MANSYLTYTQSAGTSRRKFTYSVWMKRSTDNTSGNYNSGFFNCWSDANNRLGAYFYDNKLFLYGLSGGSANISVRTNRLFRDTSAWYNIVIAVDTTQGTAADRIKFYINGVQETSLDQTTYPAQDHDLPSVGVNAKAIEVGRVNFGDQSTYYYMDGYLSHVAFVDGQALAPTVFGETDSTSGIWKFKSPSGVTWGTNGFHLKFENSGNLGLDSSGNSNTFTVNGNGRQAVDTPSNVYATWNPLEPELSYKGTYSNGNTTVATTVTGGTSLRGSIAIPYTGKWYWENKVVSTSGTIADNSRIGIATGDSVTVGSNVRYMSNGQKTVDASASSYGATYGAGDIIGVAVDSDNNTVEFFKNGASQGSISYTMDSSLTYKPYISENSNSISITFSTNFGNGYFGTTAITSAGSNGNGSLFEYDVPSGYYALNTKNINTYG